MHTPVLLQEVVEILSLSPNDRCLDGTIGSGGHARQLLQAISPNGILVGFDRDNRALILAEEALAEFGERFIGIHDSYANVLSHNACEQWKGSFRGILLDLGLSSLQLDDRTRGFSFRFPAPLDMRFDESQGTNAADILNSWQEEELRIMLRDLGGESQAARIAKAIVVARRIEPFRTVMQLVEIVTAIKGTRREGKVQRHSATKVFQALRIAVNDELAHLARFLPIGLSLLAPGGRMAIISFHSLEDRIVKIFIAREAKDCLCPPSFPECRCGHRAQLRRITKKPIKPSATEQKNNPRSRSAQLRVIEKI